MSADLLRRAADRLDELVKAAELATGEGAWRVAGVGWTAPHGSTYTVKRDIQVCVCEALTEEQADYIAAMHPRVGKAVAAWLRGEATDSKWRNRGVMVEALATARAILGEEATA